MQTLQTIGSIFAILIPVIGFIIWHFRTVYSFREDVGDLKIQIKELEYRDNLQQQTIDQLKELYPLLKKILGKLDNEKQ